MSFDIRNNSLNKSMEIASKLLSNMPQGAIDKSGIALRGSDKFNDLIRTYNRELIDQGFGIRRSALRKKDLIDMRSILTMPPEKWLAPDSNLTTEEKAFARENFWYSVIPCFTEGVLQINDGRYIYWNIKDLRVKEHSMTIMLHDYMFQDGTGWNPGVAGTLDLDFDPEVYDMYIHLEDNDFQCFSEIYTMLDYKEIFKGDKESIRIWEDYIIEFAKMNEAEFKERDTDNVREMLKLFINYIVKVNYMLSKNKPVTKRSSSSKTVKSEIDKTVETEPKVTIDERKVRTIGSMPIQSKDIPRLPTEKTIVKYKVASWKTRGFIRTLANGKKVPVRESIHHRKLLSDVGAKPITIKIDGGTKK